VTEELLRVEDLVTHFRVRRGWTATQRVHAVDGVSFSVRAGETLGLVGESGCGKSTLARSLVRLVEVTSGRVFWRGRDILTLPSAELRRLRRELQITFPDPASSLNPRMTAARIIGEGLTIHGLATKGELRARTLEIMARVGLGADHADRYPHELSGGQRQRVGLARALAVGPRLIIADEPLSALDVPVQAQVARSLRDLQQTMGVSFLLISHDLRAVQDASDRIAVMYLGRLVEVASVRQLLRSPQHPYTAALLSAVPRLEREPQQQRIVLQGDAPDPGRPPAGCRFHPRCPLALPRCRDEAPSLRTVADDHAVACFRPGEQLPRPSTAA
jgi:oligopeptide/dipeptide ABC transporter ATP-binding protein